MQSYAKPPTTYADQLKLLATRGLDINDAHSAEQYLSIVGYYRLSAYCIPFETTRHVFKTGATFAHVQSLYEFDRNLRFLLDEALEVIEITLRTAVAYHLSHTYGAFAHEDASIFYTGGYFDHSKWLAKIHEETIRSKETFVEHYQKHYLGFPKIPIWMAVEVMSLGTLSQLVCNLFRKDQIILAQRFNLHSTVFISWLHTFSYIRNICAHHSRLWNKELAIAMVVPKQDLWVNINAKRIGSVILAIHRMMTEIPVAADIHATWRKEIEQLFIKYTVGFEFRAFMGLPDDLSALALWNN